MSDKFEDELRATMRDHDREAPSAATLPDFAADDGPRLPTGGRYTWLPIAAAAAAVAALVGLTFALGPGQNRGAPSASSLSSTAASSTTASPLTCPTKYVHAMRGKLWVPAPPRGVDATAHLAPDETPAHVVVCAYVTPTSLALTGAKQLTGDLAATTATLTRLPRHDPSPARVCATYMTPADSENYLIGLTFSRGTLWVSVPGQHCQGASNGVFDTDQNLRDYAAASYRSGRWSQR